jgi:lipoate synthase
LGRQARSLGFANVASGSFVRSSVGEHQSHS